MRKLTVLNFFFFLKNHLVIIFDSKQEIMEVLSYYARELEAPFKYQSEIQKCL